MKKSKKKIKDKGHDERGREENKRNLPRFQ